MSASDIPPVPSSILKRKSDVSRAIDTTSRHTLETTNSNDGTTSMSIVKRTRPSSQALVTVPVLPEKRFDYRGKVYEHEDRIAEEGERRYSDKMYDKHWRDHPDDLAKMDHENYECDTLAKYEFNHHPEKPELDEQMHYNVKNRKKIKNGHKEFDWKKGKKAVFDGANIQDASFSEINDESAKFRKAPSRDARELGLAKKSKFPQESSSHEEPAGIAAISEWKRNAKQVLAKKDSDKLSRKVRNNNNRNDPNWLIDEAFDQLVDTGKAVGKAAKATGVIAGKAAKVGFHGAKTGIKALNEISDEIVKNPMLIKMGQVHEANMRGMASQHKHALGSIAAVGNNRRYLSASSLVKQHGYVGHTNITFAPHVANRFRVIPKIVHRKNGDTVLYFLENGRQISRAQARLIQEGILPPALSNNSSTSIANTYPTYNTNPFPLKKNTNPLLNVPRVAQATNCENENTENSVGTVAKKGNPIGEITKATTYSGLVTRAKRSLGNVKMTNTPLLNIAKMATASGLVRRNNPGVV